MKIKLSVVIPCKNEEFRIKRCLDSLKDWADEIIIIDDNSSDKTVSTARDLYGAKVISRTLGLDWGKQRNLGAQASRNDWILQLDADEVVPFKSAEVIKEILENDGKASAYIMTRVNILFDKPLLHCGSGEYIRLYDRRFAFWEGRVHEQLLIQGEAARSNVLIEHYPVDSIDHFLRKNLMYANVSAEDFSDKNGPVNTGKIRHFLTLKALKLFWKSYVGKQGYKDGTPGLIWCILMIINFQIYWLMIFQKAYKEGRLKE